MAVDKARPIIETAFERHPRPQKAIVPRLPIAVKPGNHVAAPLESPLTHQHLPDNTNPWKRYLRLGQLVQTAGRYEISSKDGIVVMIQKCDASKGSAIATMLNKLSHPNIALVRDFIEFEGIAFLCYDYFRYTLTELLAVPLRLQEPQLQSIARSVSSDSEVAQDSNNIEDLQRNPRIS